MVRSGKRRIPAQALPPPELGRKVPKKLVGVVPHDEGTDPKPVWGLSLLDHVDNAPWAVWPGDRAGLMKILHFLQSMERLSWKEIRTQITGGKQRRGPSHKPIPIESLIPEARARLEELGLDDFDELFRFRLGNLERLWGVFVGSNHVFYPLWWDCDHKVCP